MRQVTVGAFFPVVILHDNLLEPFGTRRIGFMAAQTETVRHLRRHDVVIERVLTIRTVTGFARQGLMLGMRQLLRYVGMTFRARLLTRENRCMRGDFPQRRPTIPPIFPEGLGHEQRTRDQIGSHNAQGQQHQPKNLWGQSEAAHGVGGSKPALWLETAHMSDQSLDFILAQFIAERLHLELAVLGDAFLDGLGRISVRE